MLEANRGERSYVQRPYKGIPDTIIRNAFLSLISSCGASDAYRFPVALNVSKAYAVEETIQVSYDDGGIEIGVQAGDTPQE